MEPEHSAEGLDLLFGVLGAPEVVRCKGQAQAGEAREASKGRHWRPKFGLRAHRDRDFTELKTQ